MQTKKIALMTVAVVALAVAGACTHGLVAEPQKADIPGSNWQKTASGVIVSPVAAQSKKVRLEVVSDSIVHVTASANDALPSAQSLLVKASSSGTVSFDVSTNGDVLSLKTAKIIAEVSLKTGAVVFKDIEGKAVLTSRDGGQFVPTKIDGKDHFSIRQEFNPGTEEGFYGLGQHQSGQMNYNGEDVTLAQHNMDIAVPFVVSTKNYGVLWDNYSVTRFGYPAEYPTLAAQLKLYDATGKEGGLTARYTDKGKLLAERVESDPNYQFIDDTKNFPSTVANPEKKKVPFGEPIPTSKTLLVTYDGAIEAKKSGLHKFRFYVSGYFKLWLDGKLVMDSWRQGWQGWYRNIDIPMEAGKKVSFKAEWKNEGSSYLRFLHLDPLPNDERHELSLHSDVAKAIDYYYIAGSDLDDVIAGYRKLTGQASLMPRWSYGFWQSRQRYENQDQLVSVFKKYRELKLPIDAIVQDWRYWKDPEWGSHDFDASRYPHPQKMFDAIHRMNGKLMIVIWPKFDAGIPNFKEFDDKGLMYRYSIDQGYLDFVSPGYLSSNYDAYSKEARDIYWKQIQPKLDILGPDAWWMDNDEPDIHSNLGPDDQIKMRGPTAAGPGAEFYNSYPLMHVCGFYDHWQSAHPDSRTFILTRSGFAGLQRCSASVWSGDIAARWSDMREQISAGVNFSLSGIPNWTFDIGGYTVEDRYAAKNVKPEDKAEWTELYTRWFEFGAFAPVFRSHGELVKRETFEIAKPGTPVYNILVSYQKLRYRLLPYIYSTASDTYHRAGTIMRGLVMDFPHDLKVRNINDEYMFGPSLLVAPVTEYKARSRDVYLPSGSHWYNVYTGEAHTGGETVKADAPLDRIPVFAKAGGILPVTGTDLQYSDQKPDSPITLLVYTGANGQFELYEDDGKTLGYQRGAFTRIPIKWSETTKTLSIGERSGSYPGMISKRVFHVLWITGPRKNVLDFRTKPDATLHYDGKPITVSQP